MPDNQPPDPAPARRSVMSLQVEAMRANLLGMLAQLDAFGAMLNALQPPGPRPGTTDAPGESRRRTFGGGKAPDTGELMTRVADHTPAATAASTSGGTNADPGEEERTEVRAAEAG